MSCPIWYEHAPGTVSCDGGDSFRGIFAIGDQYFTFTAYSAKPITAFQVPHAFLNYNVITQVAESNFGPDARLGPEDIYLPFVNESGKLVGTVTGKLSLDVPVTAISGTLTLASSSLS